MNQIGYQNALFCWEVVQRKMRKQVRAKAQWAVCEAGLMLKAVGSRQPPRVHARHARPAPRSREMHARMGSGGALASEERACSSATDNEIADWLVQWMEHMWQSYDCWTGVLTSEGDSEVDLLVSLWPLEALAILINNFWVIFNI